MYVTDAGQASHFDLVSASLGSDADATHGFQSPAARRVDQVELRGLDHVRDGRGPARPHPRPRVCRGERWEALVLGYLCLSRCLQEPRVDHVGFGMVLGEARQAHPDAVRQAR